MTRRALTALTFLAAVTVVLGLMVAIVHQAPALAQADVVPTVAVEPSRGVYDAPVEVTLAAEPATAAIYYTTDGTAPTTESTRYTAPIALGSTTTLRAIAIAGAIGSETETHTYAFIDTVTGHPSVRSYANSFADTDSRVAAALVGLPSVFLEYPTEPEGNDEVAVSVEYFDPATGLSVQKDASHRIFGNDSRRLPKNNYRIYFRAETGGNLKAPIFEGYDDGFTASTSFDKLDLRSSHETHSLGYPVGTYLATKWFNWSLQNVGTLSQHSRHVHLYRNGEYWGVYLLRETFDDNMLEGYFGQDQEYFFINTARSITMDGDIAYWDELVADATLSYRDYKAKWGMPTGLFDLSLTHGSQLTWRGAGGRNFGMFYILSDLDYLARTPTGTVVNHGAQGGVLKRWRSTADSDFLRDWSDRAQCFYDPGGSLDPATSSAKWAEFADLVRPGIYAEFARWGSTSFSHETWEDLIATTVADWSTVGLARRLSYSRGEGEYPKIDPVAITVTGAGGARTVTLAASGSGDIYYTLDGTDPQLGGQVAAGALRYTGPFVAPAGDFEIRARRHDPAQRAELDKWSASCPRRVLGPEPGIGLIINELNYHPADDAPDTEFVELHNTGQSPVSLAGLRLQAGVRSLTFDRDRVVAPGEFVIIAEDPNAFSAHYGFEPDASYLGSLSNGGETISLVGNHAAVLDSVAYDDADGWPKATDGEGSTLERRSDAGADPSGPAAWAVSKPGGSPGAANTAPRYLAGDVECDLDVDSDDVRAALGFALGVAASPNSCGSPVAGVTTIDLATCDVDANRSCGLVDAWRVARCLGAPDPSGCSTPG